ncbi:hypothetical protein N474_17525 [Pseudoalteromonas luteoviolacea CPMOR-2]|uniref:cupin domain-containing protein n=1 Tax=Pseudoalteromonas luteoviolacea TaxID=43657 RepID=UPI0007B09667|nr:cupin domain-containing protein [Pseudoalteromonas luteoviolacea]KZN54710.1 hypothetical protein N474_17525 [Pseudoalteromonas luteoviolacea CPMOR-2]
MQCSNQSIALFIANVGEICIDLRSKNSFSSLNQMELQAQLHFLCENIAKITVQTLADITANLVFCRSSCIEQAEIEIKFKADEIPFYKSFVRGHVEFESQAFGKVDILFEEAQFGVYLLNIEPGKSIPNHIHLEMEEHELILDSGLYLDNKPIVAGNAFSWPKGVIHGYQNRGDKVATVLCIDSPKFIPSDEIIVANLQDDLKSKEFTGEAGA